jgi:hypothetical protein
VVDAGGLKLPAFDERLDQHVALELLMKESHSLDGLFLVTNNP